MKKIIIIVIGMLLFSQAYSQAAKDTSYWKKSSQISLNFNQVSFMNWAGGGVNSISGVGLFDFSANYEKDNMVWENSINLGYGLLKEGSAKIRKSEDKINLNTKVGVKSKKNEHIRYVGFVNFKSQFADGYKHPDMDNKISALFAPAYLSSGIGADYKPSDNFSVFLSPISGKMTFVLDKELSDQGAFGVDPGKKMRSEFGATLKGEWKAQIMKNIDFKTNLVLFSNYLNNPQNVDVNWDVAINMKVNKYFSANLNTSLVYDDDILVPIDDKGNKGKRVQLKQLFGIGLVYKF